VDSNQTARAAGLADENAPTLITDRVSFKIAEEGKALPNGNMANAHAEIGAIQQAFNAGKITGKDMTMTVTGEAVCGYCVGDIAQAAEKAGLKSLTIFEEATGKTLYWMPGMKSLRVKK
jgi:filamentous hemagglutinin